MAENSKAPGGAPFFYQVTFEIAPVDEAEFNEIYDTEHIPNILQVDGVMQVIRFRDADPTVKGWLTYSALYHEHRYDFVAVFTSPWIPGCSVLTMIRSPGRDENCFAFHLR